MAGAEKNLQIGSSGHCQSHLRRLAQDEASTEHGARPSCNEQRRIEKTGIHATDHSSQEVSAPAEAHPVVSGRKYDKTPTPARLAPRLRPACGGHNEYLPSSVSGRPFPSAQE